MDYNEKELEPRPGDDQSPNWNLILAVRKEKDIVDDNEEKQTTIMNRSNFQICRNQQMHRKTVSKMMIIYLKQPRP